MAYLNGLSQSHAKLQVKVLKDELKFLGFNFDLYSCLSSYTNCEEYYLEQKLIERLEELNDYIYNTFLDID